MPQGVAPYVRGTTLFLNSKIKKLLGEAVQNLRLSADCPTVGRSGEGRRYGTLLRATQRKGAGIRALAHNSSLPKHLVLLWASMPEPWSGQSPLPRRAYPSDKAPSFSAPPPHVGQPHSSSAFSTAPAPNFFPPKHQSRKIVLMSENYSRARASKYNVQLVVPLEEEVGSNIDKQGSEIDR